MATPDKTQQQLLSYTVNNKSKQIIKISCIQARTHLKQQENPPHYQHYCYRHKQNKENVKNSCCKNIDDGFYHIKPFNQPFITITTRSSTQNQRNKFIYYDNNFKSSTPVTTIPTTSTSILSYVLHSFSYNGCSLVKMLLLGYLLLVQYAVAAPQSCILCDKNDLQAKDPQTNYEEFLFEHQVTRQDAINALRQLNESFYEGTASDGSCNGVRCTEKVMKYCLGPQFINDHCWCEVGHSTEGLPFVPHICYVGEKIYKTSVGSCFFYEEVKDCCCSSLLAKEWRHISAASPAYSRTVLHNNYVLVVIILLYLLIRQTFN